MPPVSVFAGSVLWLFFCGLAHAEALPAPFHAGERLVFQIYWSFIPAAHVTLEVAPPAEEGFNKIELAANDGIGQKVQRADCALVESAARGAAYHFILTARTLPVVDLIYKYRERVESYAAGNVQRSLLYKKVQESHHPRDIVVLFDWQKGVAQYTNFGEAIDPIVIQPGTLDPLAALYYIRTQMLGDTVSLERWVTDGRKISRGKASFVQRETISLQGKTYQTIKIEPDLSDVKGVFEKSPGAKLYIWLTDDDRKMLVKVKSKVKVGSFVAELLEQESVIPEIEKSLP